MSEKVEFDCLCLAPCAGREAPALMIAAARAGGVGLLDLEFSERPGDAAQALGRALAAVGAEGRLGLRVPAAMLEAIDGLLEMFADRDSLLLVADWDARDLAGRLKHLSGDPRRRVLLEVTSLEQAADASAIAGVSGLVARGHEAGGWVGEDTAFILTQKLLRAGTGPVYVLGGIGLHTAAACRAVGVAGVVLADQLLLMPESGIAADQRALLEGLSGQEAQVFGERFGGIRVFVRPGFPVLEKIKAAAAEAEIELDAEADPRAALAEFKARVGHLVGWANPRETAWPAGQGIALAADLARRYKTTGRLVRAILHDTAELVREAARLAPLQAGAPLAESHGTRYPIVQGPMTRVSDTARFAQSVAQAGGLPLLALAMMRKGQAESLLGETSQLLGDLPWGVGILGFVSQSLREQQLEAIRQARPPFALIAGGRPDQAARLEEEGIATYIHVPSPNLLRMFLEQGARRFVFEGRECGGHIGPLSSFVLWQQMVDVLVAEVRDAECANVHVLFAGGIHDATSAAMVATLAAPLSRRGMRIGVLMGTAYLFTREAVEGGAIQEGFQRQAMECAHTANLETGPGHATRCAVTPFVREFFDTRRRLMRDGRSADEVRDALEELNLGRLRIASKGITRAEGGDLVTIDPDGQLSEGMYMIGQVATLRDGAVGIADLHADVSEQSTRVLHATADAIRPASARPAAAPSNVAIIGIGTLLPGATYPQEFWRNLLTRTSAIDEIPRSRWDWRLYFDQDRRARDRIYSKWGGFLKEVPFDPMKYGIPPNSLRSIDPIQLLALEVVRRALEDAGYAEGGFDRENTSVILGAGGGLGDVGMQYGARAEMLRFVETIGDEVWDRLPEWTEESFAGSLLNVIAGRIANRFNFGGSNFTVDAACASSLAALNAAVLELETGRANVAIAGGVDTIQSPFAYLCFSKTQALSPLGRARTFDKKSDGIVISEGLAVVVLKRLADAERDGDRIYGVIKAVAGSSDGRALGLTAPLPAGQRRALTRAYGKAGFAPSTLGMIEAHGTGTAVGDRAEAETVVTTLRAHDAPPRSCAIGSVKTLIGHTKATAGVAGLIKATLALHHRVLPPHDGVSDPIEPLAVEDSPVYIAAQPRPWIRSPRYPRRAGVSAFGFGGTNFHAVLEEYQDYRSGSQPAGGYGWPCELFVFSAPDRDRLKAEITRIRDALAKGAQPRLRDLAYSCALAASSVGGDCVSVCFVADDQAELVRTLVAIEGHLSDGGETPLPPGVQLGARAADTAVRIAFLFPGQGSQYPNMVIEPAIYFDEVRQALEFADVANEGRYPQLLSQYVYPPAAFDEGQHEQQRLALTDTHITQPAIGAISMGLLALTRRLGLRPDMLAGHSYGEYTALYAAGCMEPQDFVRLSERRGQIMSDVCGTGDMGGMAAVQASRTEVEEYVKAFPGIVIANHNAPRQCVVSGPKEAIEAFVRKLESDQVGGRVLRVFGAFHSPLVAGAQAQLAEAIRAAQLHTPGTPVYSNLNGEPYPSNVRKVTDQLSNHIVGRVEFVRQVEAMYRDGARIFVELGPRSVLGGLVTRILGDRNATVVSLDSMEGRLRGTLGAIGAVYAGGAGMKLCALFNGRDVRALDLRQLLAQTTPPPLPATAWMLSGGSIRRPGEAAGLTGTLPPLAADTVTAARAQYLDRALAERPGAIAQPAPVPAIQAPAPAPLVPQPAAAASLPEDWAAGYASYQQTMRQFLELQERVMNRFLEGHEPGMAAGVPGEQIPARPVAPAAAPALTLPAAAAPPSPPVVATATAGQPAAAVAPAPAGAPDREGLTALVLELVSERTGYPADMLGLDQDIEAELGIDSIKRVEVLGALQKRLPGAQSEAVRAAMETLTRAKTLNAIVDQVLAAGGASTAPAPVVAAPVTAPAQPAMPDRAAMTALVLELVSERTGYPADMLGLDQDIEAELGIDSIKRVEVLGALQKRLPGAQSEAVRAAMETLTRAKTLNAIVDQVLAAGGASTAPAPVVAAPVTAPAQPAMPDRAAMTALVLELVSERTGYPADMLGLDQDIEAELGIDSIKRVEVLGALQKRLPGGQSEAVQSAMETLTRAKTLSAIVDQVLAAAGGSAAVPVAAPAPASPAPGKPAPVVIQPVPRFTMVARQAKLPRDPAQRIRGLVLVSEDELGIVDSLAGRLEAAGARVVRLSRAVLGDPVGLRAHLDKVRASEGPVQGFVHLAPLARMASVDNLNSWRVAAERDVKSLFDVLNHCHADLARADDGGFRFVVSVSGFGGVFGRGRDTALALPTAGAAVGLLKCLRVELPGVRCKAVDVDPARSADRIAAEVLDELQHSARMEVGYPAGRRTEFDTVAVSLDGAGTPAALTPGRDWVVLITGGARGITAQIARDFATYGCRLVLVGRSELPNQERSETAGIDDAATLRKLLIEAARAEGISPTPAFVETQLRNLMRDREIRGNIEALKRAGAVEVRYMPIDVRDEGQLRTGLDEVYRRYKRVDAVLHGAGVIEDKLVADKTRESFDRVYDTKVDSSFLLSRYLRHEQLQLLVFFASVAGRYGNRGQSDYAAANETVNRLAWQLAAQWPTTRVVSINWGPWDTTGMASDEVKRQFREQGIVPIPIQGGREFFVREITRGGHEDVEVVAGEGPWQKLDAGEAAVPARASVGGAALALVDPALLREERGAQVLEHTFSLTADPYLADHMLDGKAVLPVAGALEWIAEMVQAGWPDWVVNEVLDLRLFRGFVLDGAEERRGLFRARASSHADAESLQVSAELLDETGKLPYYRATVVLRPQLATAPLADLVALPAGEPVDPGTAYGKYLFHGPRFRLITAIDRLGEAGSDATVVPSRVEDWQPDGGAGRSWIFDPGLVDVAPQLAIVWSRVNRDTTALPTRFGRVARYGTEPLGPLQLAFRIKSVDGDNISYDAVFVDDSGRVRIEMQDIEGACSAALNRLAVST